MGPVTPPNLKLGVFNTLFKNAQGLDRFVGKKVGRYVTGIRGAEHFPFLKTLVGLHLIVTAKKCFHLYVTGA